MAVYHQVYWMTDGNDCALYTKHIPPPQYQVSDDFLVLNTWFVTCKGFRVKLDGITTT